MIDTDAKHGRPVTIKLTAEEHAMLRALAWQAGGSAGALVRSWIEARWDEDAVAAHARSRRSTPMARRSGYSRVAS